MEENIGKPIDPSVSGGAVANPVHGGLDQGFGWGKGARAAENGPSCCDGGQLLTGVGFNSATVPACRTAFAWWG
jgi:hypothetical protein